MFTKAELLWAFDKGMSLAKGPLRNLRHDEYGRACAIGVLENGLGNTAYCDGDGRRRPSIGLDNLESKLPPDLEQFKGAYSDDGNVYRSDTLHATLASVFNRTLSFTKAREWLDKELSRHVTLGNINEE